MIDLHLHTKYSDGCYTVEELINVLNKENIKYSSITDHNSIDAHIEYLENNYQEIYNGKMIPGTEIQTIVDDYLIEVLIYNYDIEKFKNYIETNRKDFWCFHKKAYKELIKKAQKLGLKYTEPTKELQNGYYCNMKFQEAIAKHTEYNKKIIDEKILTDHLHFYRNEFQNPNSIFFINNKEAFPKLKDLLNIAHECGATAFIAHIDEYQAITDKMEFLNKLVKEYEIDGIECFHPSISDTNRIKYIKFAKDNNLLISAGSDFHGDHLPHRKNINTIATKKDITWLK